MSAMHLYLAVLRWTVTAGAILAALVALVLWWRRPRGEVWATKWQEPEDGWGIFV